MYLEVINDREEAMAVFGPLHCQVSSHDFFNFINLSCREESEVAFSNSLVIHWTLANQKAPLRSDGLVLKPCEKRVPNTARV